MYCRLITSFTLPVNYWCYILVQYITCRLKHSIHRRRLPRSTKAIQMTSYNLLRFKHIPAKHCSLQIPPRRLKLYYTHKRQQHKESDCTVLTIGNSYIQSWIWCDTRSILCDSESLLAVIRLLIALSGTPYILDRRGALTVKYAFTNGTSDQPQVCHHK
jgi:hypothetical protein